MPFDSIEDYELVELAEQLERNPPGETPKVFTMPQLSKGLKKSSRTLCWTPFQFGVLELLGKLSERFLVWSYIEANKLPSIKRSP